MKLSLFLTISAAALLTSSPLMAESVAADAVLAKGNSQPAFPASDEGTNTLGKIPGTFSATFGVASEYVFRGVSQSDENPALSGSFDWSMPVANATDVYLGTWASNVDYNDNDEASTEFDFYGGVTHDYEAWTFNVGGIYYVYPGAEGNLDYDYWEALAAVSYNFDPIEVTGSINFSPEYFGDSGHAEYYQLAATTPLPYDLSLSGHIGRQDINNNANYSGISDYYNWSVGLGYTYEGFDLSVAYIDTDIDNSECPDLCDARAVFGISRTF